MFERFTDSARAVVVGAQQEARSLGHGWIGTEHLLLAVVADPTTPLGRRLGDLGLSHDRVRAEVHATLGGTRTTGRRCAASASTWTPSGRGSRSSSAQARSTSRRRRRLEGCAAGSGASGCRRPRRPQDCGGHIPFSRSAKKALELALRESIGLGQREIRLEHLTLGLMRADGLASTVVTRLGSSPQQVRRAVLDELGRAA